MKKQIIKLINNNADEYWKKYPCKESMVDEGSKQSKFIEEQNEKLADEIITFISDEKSLMDRLNSMCEESLSPDNFEKWEEVKEGLKLVRSNLK